MSESYLLPGGVAVGNFTKLGWVRVHGLARVWAILFVFLLLNAGSALAQSDPLPSWNDGPNRTAIVDFVKRVTTDGSADFVAPVDRIAVFDNDGTLWAEKPVPFELFFALDEVKRLAPEHPEWKDTEPFKSVLANDLAGVEASGMKGMLEIMAATHAGMSTEAFSKTVADWFATAKHPVRQKPYGELVYQPQLELLAYLRDNGFRTFIVSGGGVEFMRVFADKIYGVPPEQVIGSSGVVKYQLGADGKPELMKEPKVEFIDDGPGKPVGINRFIGRWPIMAIGNSDGDREMLEYTTAGSGARLAVYIHHDDAEREYAYDRTDKLAKFDKGWDEAVAKGWQVVSMKNDWKVIFPPSK
ncbi:Phosphoserine phosphatase [Phyllobacterium sp. YR620]|nr:Phosphoserine phosphatase [Phyllobacterium sp. YR620]SFJ09184.1 Phosphoserine phosphatase [Phyllobacterium sp. CL33Tsu]